MSYNIKQLETALGVRLFHRAHRTISLTEAGDRFYNDVSLGLSHIQRSAESIFKTDKTDHVTLSCSTAFANYWMVPRLAGFRTEHPDIDIRLQTTDKDVDLIAEGISLGIRRGLTNAIGCDSAFLDHEQIFPIASPQYLETNGLAAFDDNPTEHKLIHLDEPFRPRPGWVDWFKQMGQEYTDDGHGLHLNDYGLVIQAAMAGEGVALGWKHIVGKLIDQGLLSYLSDQPFSEDIDFYVIWDANRPLSANAEKVRDWLVRKRS